MFLLVITTKKKTKNIPGTWESCENSMDPTNNNPALVQIIACHWPVDKPSYLNHEWLSFMMHIWVIRPQWVKMLVTIASYPLSEKSSCSFYLFNPLMPSDICICEMGHLKTKLLQLMAWCLLVTSHHPNQWLGFVYYTPRNKLEFE